MPYTHTCCKCRAFAPRVNTIRRIPPPPPPRMVCSHSNASYLPGCIMSTTEIPLAVWLTLQYIRVWYIYALMTAQRKNWKKRFFLLDPFGFAYYSSETVSSQCDSCFCLGTFTQRHLLDVYGWVACYRFQ